MKLDQFYFDNEGFLGNMFSALHQLTYTNDDSKSELLTIENISNIIPHVEADIQKIYRLKPYDREDLHQYIHEKIKEIEDQIVKQEPQHTERRLELLNILLNATNEVFKKEEKKKTTYTPKQKILILEYLGVLKHFEEAELNQNKVAQIISSIIDRDLTNTTRALRFNHQFIEESSSDTKTLENLKRVMIFFNDLGLQDVAEKIQHDINKIPKEKSRQKKG